MTNQEFELIDELYFVQPFLELQKALDIEKEILKELLSVVIGKGWVGCYETPTIGVVVEKENFEKNFLDYFYLATKKGMFEHNSL